MRFVNDDYSRRTPKYRTKYIRLCIVKDVKERLSDNGIERRQALFIQKLRPKWDVDRDMAN